MRAIEQIPSVEKNLNTTINITDLPLFIFQEYDLFDEKDKRKYIDDVKKSVRGSYEYHTMVAYLRENMDMHKCSFLENVQNYGNGCKIKIELHHHPFTIEDIIQIILNKRLSLQESISLELTAKEVMYLHYNLMVGLIPLSQTAHELLHNNYIFIPNNKVYGNYKKFVNLYYNFIDPELLDRFDRLEEICEQDNANHFTVFDQNRIYFAGEGEYEIPDLNNLKTTMQNRLDTLIKQEEKKEIIRPFEKI